MRQIYEGKTSSGMAAETGCHAEIISDGKRAVLSLFNIATQTWSMSIVDTADKLASNAACVAFAIGAASAPQEQGTVTEDGDEEYFERCLALEEALKAAAAEKGVDVDDEEDDADNDFL
ncbi:hypothetical protein RZS28_14725 [Methylocapsa polymorpha]|uniref:Uncharacterized protein n=1 Tax=Methylocapsa polymorpha TaxID=3080828 RepID=A0ABZ0HP26_9HYPH|nr:hypothetical protein RZS28_14725 [Methylocapsa sp. RX1]